MGRRVCQKFGGHFSHPVKARGFVQIPRTKEGIRIKKKTSLLTQPGSRQLPTEGPVPFNFPLLSSRFCSLSLSLSSFTFGSPDLGFAVQNFKAAPHPPTKGTRN